MIFTLLKTFLVVAVVTATSKMETLCTNYHGLAKPGHYDGFRHECDVVFAYIPASNSSDQRTAREICEDMSPWKSLKSAMNETHLECQFRWYYDCDEDELSIYDLCYSVIDGEFTYDDAVNECKKDKRNLTSHSLNYHLENIWLSYFYPEHKALWVKGNGSTNTVIRPRGNFLEGVRFGGVETVPPTMKGSALCSRKAKLAAHTCVGLHKCGRLIEPQHVLFVAGIDTWTYDQAERRCTSIDGHLPSIHSKEEDLLIAKMTNYDKRYWIGLLRDPKNKDHWYWSDGSALNYIHWASGEPNNMWNEEDCVESLTRQEDGWNDQNCQDSISTFVPCKVETFRIP